MILAPAVLLFGTACAELDVTNPNQPDIQRALASPEDVVNIASSSVNSWWLASTHYEPYMMLQVTADAATANFGNFGMRFNNEEPRIPYNNNSSSGDEQGARRPWTLNYSALGAANDAGSAIAGGLVIPGGAAEAEKVQAAVLFTQAGVHMNLALLFDQAFVITTPPTAPLPTLKPYAEVRDSALALWAQLITLTNGKTWEWNNSWLPTPYPLTASALNRIANTMAARTMVLSARNATENAATDWAQVLAYADKGLTGTGLTDMDFSIVDDGGTNWYDYIKLYGNLHSWTRVDQRLINRMASNIPVTFNGLTNQPTPVPEDNRLVLSNGTCDSSLNSCLVGITADYVYTGRLIGDPGRGIWMQSPFYHRRWRASSFAVPDNTGAINVNVLAAENDLMIAEAEARRAGGDLTRAAALVNKTHVTRGGRTAVAANQAAILAAIEYERDVELLNTGGISLFDRRRVNGIQNGTFRHLPIPARELEVLGLPVYTFGGVGLPDM
jgi:hypothetical protein